MSWFDRNSNYNNYFDNISTGQWFRFVSRQAVVDHVWTVNSTTVMNVRYGYDRFLRGDQGNPGNFGMDLTTLGLPRVLQQPHSRRTSASSRASTSPATREPASRVRTASPRTRRRSATITKTMGAHSIRTGAEWRQYREKSTFSANNQTGQFNFGTTWTRGPLDNSAGSPELARPVVRGVPARPAGEQQLRQPSTTATTSSRRRPASSFRTTGGSDRS